MEASTSGTSQHYHTGIQLMIEEVPVVSYLKEFVNNAAHAVPMLVYL